MVRAAQKGEMENPSPEVAEVAATTKRSSVKKFAKTKHKGLPEKKVRKESFNEDYVKELEDGLVKMDYPSYDEVDKLMCKIAKENDIDTTTLHMAFKTKHLMVPDDWAKKKMFEPIMIPKTPEGLNMKEESQESMLARVRKAQSDISGDEIIKAKKGEADKQHQLINKDIGIKSKKPVEKPKLKNPEKEFHSEGNLRQWFKGSKSKDGKGGWVNVVTGGTCASDKPGEGTPKCVSSSKRASMTKAERLSAQRRKKAADPGQQSKRNAAKPTYVSTDKKKKVNEDFLPMILELSDSKMQRQSDENLDALQKKFTDMSKDGSPSNKFMLNRIKREQKRRLQQKQKESKRMAAQNNNPKAAQVIEDHMPEIQEDCWDGYEKKGMKTMFGKRYPNCVKKKKTRKESFEINEESKDLMKVKGRKPSFMVSMLIKQKKKKKRDEYGDLVDGPKITKKEKEKNLKKNTPDEQHTTTTSEGYSANPAQQAAIAIAKKEKKERDMVAKKMRKEDVKMSRKAYNKLHKDFKSDDPKNPRTTKYVPGKGTVSMPVTFTDEYVPEGNEMADKQSLSAKTLRRKKPVSKSELAQNQMKSTTRRNKPGTGGDEGSGIYDMSNIGRTSYSGHGEDSIEVSGPGQGKPKVGKVKSYKVDPKTLKDEYVPEGKEKLVYGDFGNYTKNQKVDKKKEKKLKEPPYEALASDYAPDMSMVEDMSGMSQKSGDKRSTESGAGMTAKGVAKYNRRTGGNLKTAVTTPPSKLKPGSKAANRRKSFCARSKGWTGERGKAARRRWNCNNGFEPENGEMINEYKTMLDTIKRKVSVLGGKSNKKSKSDYVGKKDAGAIAKKVLQQKQHKKYVNFLDIDEEKKKCGEGEYYCNDDKKCKPIPKGYKIGYGGYLKPENKEDESNGKKGGSNGNGNGNGGNGNGHGGNGNGGNGGGNGGGE